MQINKRGTPTAQTAGKQGHSLWFILLEPKLMDHKFDNQTNATTQTEKHTIDGTGPLTAIWFTKSDLGRFLKVAQVFRYFGFLRQSNLAPCHSKAFNPTCHMCLGNGLIQSPGIVIILKWTKCNQFMDKPNLIPIMHIANSSLDPVSAFQDMIT